MNKLMGKKNLKETEEEEAFRKQEKVKNNLQLSDYVDDVCFNGDLNSSYSSNCNNDRHNFNSSADSCSNVRAPDCIITSCTDSSSNARGSD